MKTVKVKVKCLIGDKCMALNYRRRPADWEPGEVVSVGVGVERDGTTRSSYRVMLDRRGNSRRNPNESPIFVTVGDSGIEKI